MEQVLDGFRLKGSAINRLRHAVLVTFQIHLVARGDDCSKVLKKNLEQSAQQFPDLLTVWLAWSKNVKVCTIDLDQLRPQSILS